jgi:hypothetical protein
VSGCSALAGRWCSASSACFSTELQVYLNGQWCELFELQVMMRHGLIAPHLHRNNVCESKYAPKVNYSATVFFVWLVISLSIYLFYTFLSTSKHYLLEAKEKLSSYKATKRWLGGFSNFYALSVCPYIVWHFLDEYSIHFHIFTRIAHANRLVYVWSLLSQSSFEVTSVAYIFIPTLFA